MVAAAKMGASAGASSAAVESTVATALCSGGVQVTMFSATLLAVQPCIQGSGITSAISIHAPSLACWLAGAADWVVAGLDAELGSFASSPSSAVANALASDTAVPVPTLPSETPCCDNTPATLATAMSSPAADVFG